MAMIVIALLVILAISVSFWMLGGLIQLLLMLFMAGLVGWLADQAIPGRLPYGWLGAIAAGLVGSWLGTAAHRPRRAQPVRYPDHSCARRGDHPGGGTRTGREGARASAGVLARRAHLARARRAGSGGGGV